jgi:hypothetical protein
VFGFTPCWRWPWPRTQFLLDRGEGEGWFGSDLVIVTAAIAILSLYHVRRAQRDDERTRLSARGC